MQRLFDYQKLHPDSLPQAVNMGCRQSQSSLETATVITEIESGLVGLRGNFCHNQLSKTLVSKLCENPFLC